MAMFGLILLIVTIMSLRFEVRGEITADLVISLLKETYSLKSELRTSVAAINNRIDNIENTSKQSPLDSNTYNTDVPGKRNEMVDPENMNSNDLILKALAAEKIYVRNVLTDYEKKLIEFQSAVSDQMNVMNTTIEASREIMGRKLEENTGNINKSVHQLMTLSETKFQDVIKEFETTMNNTSIEHEKTRSDLREIQNTVKDIEDDSRLRVFRLDHRGIAPSHTGRWHDDTMQSVGFTAILEHFVLLFNANKVVAFENVTNNHGGGYNERTGIFTAPSSGFYIFHVTVTLVGNHRIHLYVGKSRKAELVIDSFTGSNTTVAYMSLGQQAYVGCTEQNYISRVYGGGMSSFTGVLVN